MISNRKWAFMLGALAVAGIGLNGCEEQDLCPECNRPGGDGTSVSKLSPEDSRLIADFSASDLKNASSECKSSSCSSSSACKSGVNYVACLCSDVENNPETCHTFPNCKGIGACTYECGESSESCGWPVCVGSDKCSQAAVIDAITIKTSVAACEADENCKKAADFCMQVAALNPDMDFDGDSVLNKDELMFFDNKKDPSRNFVSHPCFVDSDGNGVADNSCDREVGCWGGGKMKQEEAILHNQYCKIAGNSDSIGQFKEMTIALLKDANYLEATGLNSRIAFFSDTKNKVVGFFGSGQSKNGGQLLDAAGLQAGTYIEESNFTSSVPLSSWIEKGYKGEEGQVVPNSDVLRLRYSIETNGMSLEEIALKIGAVFDKGVTDASSFGSTTKCDGDGKAALYLARSSYSDSGNRKLRVYSGALACANVRNTRIETAAVLDDVLSGTLVAPKNVSGGYSGANANGYLPYQSFHCQVQTIGQASGAVDFIWVVDNSGSMADELDAISATARIFAEQLAGSGIDYRVAVTTTDAYVLDEKNALDVLSNDTHRVPRQPVDQNNNPIKDKYFNGIGARTPSGYSMIVIPGFITKPTDIYTRGSGTGSGSITYFQRAIVDDRNCSTQGGQKNICGFGYEDGFGSGAFILSRLAANVSESPDPATQYTKDNLNVDDQAAYDNIVALKKKLASCEYLTAAGGEVDSSIKGKCKPEENTQGMQLRYDALKYVIWVSDEESRQFKEKRELGKTDLSYCKNSKKLEGGRIPAGDISSADVNLCNAEIVSNLSAAIEENIEQTKNDANAVLLQDMSLDEIKANGRLADYAAMLEYYLGEYRRFAGSGGIAGFSIVGDIGNRNGGRCNNLMACTGTCYVDANDKVGHIVEGEESGCFDCSADGVTRNTGWKESSKAVLGANYGLSYIHLARFLSLTTTDDGQAGGKEGGFASICTTNYETTIKAIIDDVSGRVASHTLEKYPISSTIRVAVLKAKTTTPVELKRGATTNGFTYDASQNAVVFVNVGNMKAEDWFVISYDVWSKGKG